MGREALLLTSRLLYVARREQSEGQANLSLTARTGNILLKTINQNLKLNAQPTTYLTTLKPFPTQKLRILGIPPFSV